MLISLIFTEHVKGRKHRGPVCFLLRVTIVSMAVCMLMYSFIIEALILVHLCISPSCHQQPLSINWNQILYWQDITLLLTKTLKKEEIGITYSISKYSASAQCAWLVCLSMCVHFWQGKIKGNPSCTNITSLILFVLRPAIHKNHLS